MVALPSGTLTLLCADIDGSTRLVRRLGSQYPAVIEEHRALLGHAIEAHHGRVVTVSEGQALAVFERATDALAAAELVQRRMLGHQWPDGVDLRVRIGLHTGEPTVANDTYVGVDIQRAARICAAGHGGQVLLSQSTHSMVRTRLPANVSLHNLGLYRLKGLDRVERLHQL